MKNNPAEAVVGRRQRSSLHPGQFLWLIAIMFGLQGAQAQFSLPLYERFNYTNNEPLGANGGSSVNWSWGNSASGSSFHPETNSSLSYIGIPADTTPVPGGTTPGGLLSNTGTGKIRGATFSNPVTNVTIYASFMLNVRSLVASSSDRLLWGLGTQSTGSSTADGGAAVWMDPSGRLKVSKNSIAAAATNTTYALVLSNTYFVVFSYKTNNGSPDQVNLWLNPTTLGNNSSIPAPDLTTTNNDNAATFISMAVNGNAPNHVFWMDEFRVSTNWADVTPTTSWASNSYSVTGGGSGCNGDSFVIGLNGSDSGITYLLYTNGVVSSVSVVGTGSSISFGAQSTTATYTVLATNTADTTVHWMSGNAVVSVLSPPTISTQPVSVLAATNSSVVFIVSASGSGLKYQWYRNGTGLVDGGDVSGSATPILNISPATSADAATTAAGYYCIITNSCGYSATTVTNALTLHAPGNIVWQGTPTNLWDIATTADWTNSAGAAVVFNPGDNVTLNDTFVNPILALQSPYLSPGVISYVGSQNMFINGNGNINLNGNISGLNSSLLINGTGTLAISNANSFAGGTTISNGILLVETFNGALGSGPVTLAGGTFRLGVSGGTAAQAITNNFFVAANSTVQYDGTGGNAFNFGGTLTGVTGQTLTIYNNSIAATLNWMRLVTGFTNNANIVLSSPGAAMEITPVLNGVNQIFNGTISGNFGRMRPGGGSGSVIFNSTNTYNDSGTFAPSGISLYMTGGGANAGFGADSVSSTPPTIDASPAGTGNIGIDVGSDGGNCGFFASGGAHTVGNPIIYTSATNSVLVSIVGNNNLTLSGAINLSGADSTGNTNRTFSVTNSALTTFSGTISDGGLTCGIIKTGNGTLDLNGANTYTGSTTVSNGILAGIGSIAGPVTVATNGSAGAGTASVGTLTINNNLTLNGNGFFKLNKSVSPSNDLVSVSGTLASSGTGTITVTNIGVPALAVGDKFYLFSQAVTGGNTLTIVGGGMNWTNKLSVDGSIQALSVGFTTASYPTNITATLNGSNLQITWPATHLGWMIQAQTNTLAVGLSTDWVTISNTATQLGYTNTIDPTKGGVFYRLIHP
jgi:autotransporter-associated beta strand protein